MKKFSLLLTLLAVVAIIAFSIYGMKWVAAKKDAAAKAQMGKRSNAVAVRTGVVGRADISNILTFNGDIEAILSVELQPKVSGRLQSLQLPNGQAVEEGVRVKSGDQIAQIDDRDYQAKLTSALAVQASAEAAITAAEAALEQKKADQAAAAAETASARANQEDKLREWERQKNLWAAKATTSQQLDQAGTALTQANAELQQAQAEEQAAGAEIKTAEADILKAKAALKQAEANRAETELNFAETRIYAPMDCVVGRKYVDPGSMVSATTPIVQLVSIETVKALISVPVNQLAKIIPGKTKATLTTDAMPGKSIECTIYKIYPTVNTVTRTAQVELRLKNPTDATGAFILRPGMYVAVAVILEDRPNVVAIDLSLPIRSLDKQLVFVCRGDKVQAVPVKLGTSFGNLVEVTSGLQAGDEVVVQGQHRLTDGSTIRRVNDTQQ